MTPAASPIRPVKVLVSGHEVRVIFADGSERVRHSPSSSLESLVLEAVAALRWREAEIRLNGNGQ